MSERRLLSLREIDRAMGSPNGCARLMMSRGYLPRRDLPVSALRSPRIVCMREMYTEQEAIDRLKAQRFPCTADCIVSGVRMYRGWRIALANLFAGAAERGLSDTYHQVALL